MKRYRQLAFGVVEQDQRGMARFGYIDALRGLAMLGVIAVHATIGAQGLPTTVAAIVAQGRHGVQLFFV